MMFSVCSSVGNDVEYWRVVHWGYDNEGLFIPLCRYVINNTKYDALHLITATHVPTCVPRDARVPSVQLIVWHGCCSLAWWLNYKGAKISFQPLLSCCVILLGCNEFYIRVILSIKLLWWLVCFAKTLSWDRRSPRKQTLVAINVFEGSN